MILESKLLTGNLQPPLQFDKSFNENEMLSLHYEICRSNTGI